MRIISDFHDYYDCAQSYGQDMETIYQRKEKEIEYKEKMFPFFYGFRYNSPLDCATRAWVIGFCGNIYPVLEVCKNEDSDYCYNIEQLESSFETNFKKKEIEEYYLKKTGWKKNKKSGRDNTKKYFAKYEEKKKSYERLFKENRSPLFVAKERKYYDCLINYNAPLKDFEFYKIFDPHTAYQEISMYMYNFAEPMKEIPEISDETMAEIKGFDKWSFRKEPKKGA